MNISSVLSCFQGEVDVKDASYPKYDDDSYTKRPSKVKLFIHEWLWCIFSYLWYWFVWNIFQGWYKRRCQPVDSKTSFFKKGAALWLIFSFFLKLNFYYFIYGIYFVLQSSRLSPETSDDERLSQKRPSIQKVIIMLRMNLTQIWNDERFFVRSSWDSIYKPMEKWFQPCVTVIFFTGILRFSGLKVN